MADIETSFRCDGRTRYKLSSFITENAVEIKLTNDERKQLLAVYNPQKQVQTGIMLLVMAIFAFVMGIIFCAVAKVIQSLIGTVICLLPCIILLIAGIYQLSTAPNIEKSIIRAYEFTVTDIKHRYYLRSSSYSNHSQIETVMRITQKDAEKYNSSHRDFGNKKYILYLQLDGKWVQVDSAEGFASIRFGIKTGDKVRCAVLEYGKYCYISLY